MPKYSINGHTYESDKELSDDEIDEIGGWEKPAEKNLWEKANTPFSDAPSRWAASLNKQIESEGTPGFGPQASVKMVGDIATGMLTPYNAVMTAAFGFGGPTVAKYLPQVAKYVPALAKYLPGAAKASHNIGRAMSVPMGVEGARNVARAETPTEALFGGLQAAGGYLGARSKYTPYVPKKIPSMGIPSGQEYTPSPARLGYGETPSYRTDPAYGSIPTSFGETPRGGLGVPPPTVPPRPPNVPPPNAPTPVTEDIAETIRKISQSQRQRPIEPPPPPIEDPFTPIPEPPPFDPRDPRVMGQEIPYEPPPSGEVGPPATPAMPPEITTPNMIPERPILDRSMPTNLEVNPLAELAARKSGREGNVPRTAHAEPPMGVEPEPPPSVSEFDAAKNRQVHGQLMNRMDQLTPEEIAQLDSVDQLSGKPLSRGDMGLEDAPPNPVAAPPPIEGPGLSPAEQAIIEQQMAAKDFADQVVPPTEAQSINQAIMPPATTAPAGKKGGLRPRQKFETKTFAPGPPRPAPVQAAPPPVEAPIAPPVTEAPPRLVKTKKGGPQEMTTTNAPSNAPKLEHIIATNGDELQQYMAEGYQVVGKRTDGAIVMERVAAEAPPTAPKKSLAAEIEEGQAKVKAEYEVNRKRRAHEWGLTRRKAKELGVDLKGVEDVKTAEKLIQAKDPNWSTPEYAGGEQPPATASERMPKKKESWQPGGLKHGKRFDPAPEADTGVRKWWNEARGLMSVDFPWMTSAAFRQGLPFIGTKYWRSAFSRAAKAYKSQEAYNQVMTSIEVDPLFQPTFDPRVANPKMGRSIAEIAGLKFIKPSEIGGAEGITRGPITSKLWYTGASDRSFAAFTNHLRAWTFKRLLKDAGVWDEATKRVTNEPLAREIADFVNTASGRGKLEIGYGPKKGQTRSLEQSARALTDAFFSPRLMFSRIKMMNPATYAQASPFVRKQYTAAMIRTIGAWWTIASLAEWGGKLAGEKVSVSKDPNNADFGKIRIGNTRIDPGGGFQQFLVATHRLMPSYGKHKPAKSGIAAVDLALGLLTAGGGTTTSSVTGNKSILGRGYKAETRWDLAERFVASKLHPSAKLLYDAANASEKYPVYLGDRLLQMALPMMVPDVIEALQNDPEMAPMIFFASNLGMGAQTYEGGRVEKPAITAPIDKMFGTKLQKYDYAIGGK